MAEHAATALSPPPPRDDAADEAEFAALLGALQGTARGRRFLEEFARRQRNADTVMVLDAVARIEARLAAGEAGPPPAAPPAAAAELVRVIDEGRAALAQAAEALAVFETLKARLDAAGSPAPVTDITPAPKPAPAAEPIRTAPPPPADVPAIDVPAPEAAMTEPPPAAVLAATPAPEPIRAAPTPAPAATPAADEPPQEEAPLSLGQTLLTEGMVTLPAPPAADALAALRRMTQADKLAFFS